MVGSVGTASIMAVAQPADAVPLAPPYSGTGRPPVTKYPEPARRVKALVIEAGKGGARPVQWHEGSRPGTGRSGFKRMYSRFVALRIRPAGREIRKAVEGPELPTCWLPMACERSGAGAVLVLEPARGHTPDHPRQAGETALADRARLP